jgi:hypothetical protein
MLEYVQGHLPQAQYVPLGSADEGLQASLVHAACRVRGTSATASYTGWAQQREAHHLVAVSRGLRSVRSMLRM